MIEEVVTKLPGIYRISCLANKHFYIGKSNNLNRRRVGHLTLLARQKDNRNLQKDWNKFGKNSFTFEIIETNENLKNENPLNQREQFWLDKYCGQEDCYNISKNSRGISHPEETRKRMSEAAKKRGLRTSNMLGVIRKWKHCKSHKNWSLFNET